MYNLILQQYKRLDKYLGHQTTIFLVVALAMSALGLILLEVSTCKIASYIYTSGRLDGNHIGFLCHIF